MERVEQDERRRKVEAGRAKLAQFQQRKTKGNGPSSKKKTSKRKSSAVHAAVWEKEEECAVVTLDGKLPPDLEQSQESQESSDPLDAKAESEPSILGTQKNPFTELNAQEQIPEDCRSCLATDLTQPEVPRAQAKIKMLEEKLMGKQEDIDQLSHEVGELQARLVQCTEATELQQALKMAVQERDSIIVRLISNLQQARRNGEDVQQEALLLANQIHDLQHQLQENSELLKSKMAARGGGAQRLPQAAACLQCPQELDSPQQPLHPTAQTLEEQLASAQVVEEKGGPAPLQPSPVLLSEQAQPPTQVCTSPLDCTQEQEEELDLGSIHGMTVVEGKAPGPPRPGPLPTTGIKNEELQSLFRAYVHHSNGPKELSDMCTRGYLEAFQIRDETGCMEKLKVNTEESLDSKGDDSYVQVTNGKLLQNSRELRPKHVEEIIAWDLRFRPLEQEERMFSGDLDVVELQRLQSPLNFRPGWPVFHEPEDRDVHPRCSAKCEGENQSVKLDMSDAGSVVEVDLSDEEAAREGWVMDGGGHLMEKYLVSTTQQGLSSISEPSEYFDLETALQSKSETEPLGFVAEELIVDFHEKIDSNLWSEGKCAPVGSCADLGTSVLGASGFSLSNFDEIHELMGKKKVYLMQHHLLGEKDLTLEPEEAEDTWWEDAHGLRNGLNQEGVIPWSHDKPVPSLEEEGESQLEAGAAASGVPHLAAFTSVAPQALQQPLMAEVMEKKGERPTGRTTPDSVPFRVLCGQEDRLQALTGTHEVRNQGPAGCLRWETSLEESLWHEVEALKSEIALKENLFTQIVKEKNILEEKVSKDRENLEEHIFELCERIKHLEKGQRHEKIEFAGNSAPSDGQKLDAGRKTEKSDLLQTENNPVQQIVSLTNGPVQPEWRLLQDAREAACTLDDVCVGLSSHAEKQMNVLKSEHEAQLAQLRWEHQKEVEDVREKMKEELDRQQQQWEEARKEQIGKIKKIHEREHGREIAALVSKHQDELKQLREELHLRHQQMIEELRQQMDAAHQAEREQAQQQAQTLHTLELEALRLSLSNMHTAQLELTQANLQKEKETALVELREMLNDKRAQEVALLQSRQQFELEHITEQHQKEKEEIALKHGQEIAALQKKLDLEVETHARTLETLKGDWDAEKGLSLTRLKEELSGKHQEEMERVRQDLRAELADLKAELEQVGHDKDQAEAALRSLQAQHQEALRGLREELQLQHDQYLQDLNLKFREKQQELDTLQASYEELQIQSREEIQELWSQLDSTRANRQELNELKEQLRVRASHVEQMEHLKHDFEQRQQRRRSEHEAELEQLRIYFEQKLKDAEESYREDLSLLHQRLQEVKEDSFLDSADVSLSIGFVEEASEVERKALLDQLMLQLEQHKEAMTHLRLQLEEKHRDELDTLKSSLETSHQEAVAKVKAELSEKYNADAERLQQQHTRELEELRACLTDEHRKEMTKLRLHCAQDAARQVEVEVAERASVLEDDHKARVAQLQSEEGLILRLTEEISMVRRETAELQEQLQQEIRLKEAAEQLRCSLVEDHQEEVKKMKEEIEHMIRKDKDKEEAWQVQSKDASRKAEERLAMLTVELTGKAEEEQQAQRKAFDLRLLEMERLRDQQTADITRLEKSLRETQERLAQREAAWKAQAARDLEAAKAQLAKELEVATRALQKDSALELQRSQQRFSEEHEESLQKITKRQDALLQELQEKHASELQMQSHQLQEKQQQQTEALTSKLQSKHQEEVEARVAIVQSQHQEEVEALRASLQSEHQAHLEARLAEVQSQHGEEVEALKTSLQSEHQVHLEACLAEARSQHREEMEARVAMVQSQHREKVEALRASLEREHQAHLEARLAEVQSQHREEVEALRASLQREHQAHLEACLAEVQSQHQEEVEALRASLQREHQAHLEACLAEVQSQHQEEVEALRASLEREHQVHLEARLAEVQSQHREEVEALRASLQREHQEHLEARLAEVQSQHLEEVEALQASLQREHQAHLEARLAEVRCQHQEEMEGRVVAVQTQHASEMSELEEKHLANLDSLESCFLSEIHTLQEEHSQALARLQGKQEEQLQAKAAEHEAQLAQEMEKHQQVLQLAQERLKLEMTADHVDRVKALAEELREAHQEDLQAALHSQRCLLEEESHQALDRLGEEVLRMEEQHRAALQELKDIHVAELEKQRAQAALQLQEEVGRLRRQHEEELEREKHIALQEAEELLAAEKEKAQTLYQREKEALTQQLQEQNGFILQLKEKVSSLSKEVSELRGELEKLQARREREHEEGTTLISLLRSDVDRSQNDRKALKEANQRLLSLFGDTVKAAITMKSQISKRIGLCLDEDCSGKESSSVSTFGPSAKDLGHLPGNASPLGHISPLQFDQTLPECDETLLTVTDVSSHVRESFFLSPEVTVECEQPIRRIYQSLGTAVDDLLDMILDSRKQLEETHNIHTRFEEEFHRKNEETAQVVRQHQELMDCLNQESATKNQLALELHKAEGLAEGYKAEKVALEEVLAHKEKSEHRLAVELETLKAQFQALVREHARVQEEQSQLLRQKEVLIAEAEDKAAGLLKEVERLVRVQSETQQQSEKDCSSLRSQMRALELELEDQFSHSQELAQRAAEILDLKQQIASLDKHLRNQRQFMDEQAVEREHERDEFQQEIRKLEAQLKQPPARSQLWGESQERESLEVTTEVEFLQRKLREKIDELNELAIKKELAERQLIAQKDEIQTLEDTNAEIRKKVSCLEEELEKQKKIGKELKGDKEALQEQQMNNLIQISTLQSKLDEARYLKPGQGSSNEEVLKEQLKTKQESLLMKEREVLSLEEELKQLKNSLTNKNEEILQLNLELALQSSQLSTSIHDLSLENADVKALLQSKEKEMICLNEQIQRLQHEVDQAVEPEVMERRNSEIEELKAIIENLHENQERLRKDNLEEIERLHEVIEKLQEELSLLGPVVHEVSDSQGDSDSSQAENLQRELEKGLFPFPDSKERKLPDPRVKELQEELEALLAAKESLVQLLEDKESQFQARVQVLELDLQSVREASTEQLDLLRLQLSQKEAEAKRMASRAQQWQATLQTKQAEVDSLNRERGILVAELAVLALACSHLERELEQKRRLGSQEPPELQMLRAQCVGLNLKLQGLSQKLVTYQMELDQHQACGPQCQVQIRKHLKELNALSTPEIQEPERCHSSWVSVERPPAPAPIEEESSQEPGPWQPVTAAQGQCGDGLNLVKDQWRSAKALVIRREAGLQRRDNGISVLTVCQKQLESELIFIKNKMESSKKDNSQLRVKDPMESDQPQRGDLIIQVRHIQEKLHLLINSISNGGQEAEGRKHGLGGLAGCPVVAGPPKQCRSPISWTARNRASTDQVPRPLQGSFSDILHHSLRSLDFPQSQDPPGKFDKILDSPSGSPAGDASDVVSLSPEYSYFEDRVTSLKSPQFTKSHESPPLEELSHESPRSSPSSACSAESTLQAGDHVEALQHFRDTILDTDTSLLGSPELVRKDSMVDRVPSVDLTPLSQAAALQSPGLAWRSWGLQDSLGDLVSPTLLGLEMTPRASEAPVLLEKSQLDARRDIKRRLLEQNVEDFILTPTVSQEDLRCVVAGVERESNGQDITNFSDFPHKLKQDSERAEPSHACLVTPLPKSGMVQRSLKLIKDKEMQPKQMKAIMKMVHDESQQILVLSKVEAPGLELGRDPQLLPLDSSPRERQDLLEAMPAIECPTQVLPQGEEKVKEPPDTGFDWGGEFLQAVQEALEKERKALRLELQSKLYSPESGDERSLLEKLKDVVKEQGELQKRTLEDLHVTDRSSLLSEIQALRSQLRMTHLQNQEKLQQLYEALTSVEDHGSQQEYQFRRQVELLEYKIEQEKCLTSDLQNTLAEEQEKVATNQKLLLAAQNAAQELKAELEECKQEKENKSQALCDAQKEATCLRSTLEEKEGELKAALDALQSEKHKGKELQTLLAEEQRQSLEKEQLRTKTIEELQASLDKQCGHNSQLSVSLQHEQAEKENLKKELQIEYSRCEALLCQERSRVTELQKALEAEKGHSTELGEALAHERVLTEQLSKRASEACSQKETQLQHAFVRKLKEEKARASELQARATELQARLEDAHQQILTSKKQLELEVQMRCEEVKKEKEVSVLLQASVETLQKQKQELLHYLEEERADRGRLQAELEQMQSRLKEEAGKEARREKEKRQADEEKWKKWKKDKERLRELELQRQRDEHKIRQLQQTITELEEKEKCLLPSRHLQDPAAIPVHPDMGAEVPLPPNVEKLREHPEQLENMRQQLLHAAGLVTNFMNQPVTRTIGDWTSNNEKAVTSLLLTLEDLKSDLTSTLPQKKSAQTQIGLIDVLLKENGSLTKALSTMTQEKAELCKTVSKLEKTLKHHLQRGCGHIYKYVDRIGSLQKADRAPWKQQKLALHGSRHGEPGVVKTAFKSEATFGGNTCHIRMEKLYLHFLRAESFRKALIYQKRYLLLLIGGFQDSEQETLSMIAHLGVFPSKMDKRAFSSRPFTKFRTAVRVVIAILRLRFLVKKWQELDRRGTFSQSSELSSVPEDTAEVMRQPPHTPLPLSSSPLLPETPSSPPTQDVSSSSLKSRRSPSPAYHLRDRFLPSPSSGANVFDSSHDPEHSLTEYIHHLEVIQQRLGGVQPELNSKKHSHQKKKK